MQTTAETLIDTKGFVERLNLASMSLGGEDASREEGDALYRGPHPLGNQHKLCPCSHNTPHSSCMLETVAEAQGWEGW